jgi:hypothetical protein
MAPPKVVTGARVIVSIADANIGSANEVNVPAGVQATTICGTFDNCSYGVVYGIQAAPILGAMAPAELGYTHSEPVAISASAWRVVGAGPHVQGHVPTLQELLSHEYLVFTVTDRQTGKIIATLRDVRSGGYNTALQARQLESMTLNFMGRLPPEDETATVQAETPAPVPGATLP